MERPTQLTKELNINGNTCLELALEGERLCKGGDFHGGVAFFEAAISVGTDDLKTLSAIYSQLGNAYFYVAEYSKAMEYHKLDLTVARAIGDRLGEAKASGNLGNSLKMMGRFDEAIICCKRHLDISHHLDDKVGESRALYNLGNVYHSKGKHIAGIGHQDPGEFPEEVKVCLQKAVDFYQENLKLMTELGDRLAQGRAYGNLGNTHYLLGNFGQAISFHQERLKLAKEFGDKSAERRAYNNLGNAHIFLGEFESAAIFFKKTLTLAEELGDRAVEAQACYSLGNTYTLLRDYPVAIEYHLRHLRIAQDLRDKVGESRAYWSLGNAHSAMGSHQTALTFANKHLEISKELGDCSGQVTAQISISDLRKILGFNSLQSTPTVTEKSFINNNEDSLATSPTRPKQRFRRISMEKLDLLKLTPEARATANDKKDENKENVNSQNSNLKESSAGTSSSKEIIFNKSVLSKKVENNGGAENGGRGEGCQDDEHFFDLLSRFQSERMDEQRCDVEALEGKHENNDDLEMGILGQSSSSSSSLNIRSRKESLLGENSISSDRQSQDSSKGSGDDFFEMIAGMQSRRMDEQRANLPRLPGMGGQWEAATHRNDNQQQLRHSRRLQNQPSGSGQQQLQAGGGATNFKVERHPIIHRGMSTVDNNTTLPDDDFFDMLMRCQSTRIEDQRSSMPDLLLEPNHHPITMGNNSLMQNSIAAGSSASMASSLMAAGPSSVTANNISAPGENRTTTTGSHGATVPDDDFFTLILRFQGGRIEDQRSSLPSNKTLLGGVGTTASLDRERHIGGSLRNTRTTGGSLLKSSLKHGLLGTRLSK